LFKILYMKKLCFLFITGAAIISCNQPAGSGIAAGSFNLDSAKAGIATANSAFSDAFGKGDSAAVAALYTKDACLMMTGMPKLCGAAAIGDFTATAKKMGIGGIKLTTVDLIGCKDLVSEEGIYEMMDLKGAPMEKGKYIVVWKMEDGKWKLYRDISNADTPPPTTTPAKM
jgi:uncharacterized protein (TIGR02246 family)